MEFLTDEPTTSSSGSACPATSCSSPAASCPCSTSVTSESATESSERRPRSPTRSSSPRSRLLPRRRRRRSHRCGQTKGHGDRRSSARRRLCGLPNRRCNRPRPARPPLAQSQHALPDGWVQLPLGSGSMGVPGGTASAQGRDRPSPAAGALPREPADMQRLPGEGGAHRLRPRSRDCSVARPMAALGGRTVPPGSLRCPRPPRCPHSPIALVRSNGTADLLALSALVGISIALAGRLLGALRRTPTGFPAASPATPDPSIAARRGPPA